MVQGSGRIPVGLDPRTTMSAPARACRLEGRGRRRDRIVSVTDAIAEPALIRASNVQPDWTFPRRVKEEPPTEAGGCSVARASTCRAILLRVEPEHDAHIIGAYPASAGKLAKAIQHVRVEAAGCVSAGRLPLRANVDGLAGVGFAEFVFA